MYKFFTAVVIVIAFAASWTSSLQAQPVVTGNKFVTARVEPSSGKVTVVTTPGGYYGGEKALSYNDMSFLTVNINGKLYTNNDQLVGFDNSNPQYGGYLGWTGSTARIADTVRTIWKVPTGELIQDVYPVEFDFSGQILFKWSYHSLTYDGTQIQMQYLLDTRIVQNDMARLLTRFGYKNHWQLFATNNANFKEIPNFYQAFEHDLDYAHHYNPGVVSQGTLISADLGLSKPDAVCVGDWPDLSLIPWGYPPPPFTINPYTDSAILLMFDAQGANGGQTVEIARTAYGTGEFETCTGGLYALIFRPRILKPDATGTSYRPDPFTVEMYLFNTDQYTQVTGANATLTVGPHLTILDSGATNNNTMQRQLAVPQTIVATSVGTCTWHVYAERTCDQDTSWLKFTWTQPIDTIQNSSCILPVPLPCLDKDTLPPQSYPIVANGFTKAIAFDDNRPKDKGIQSIQTYGFDTRYFDVSIDPFSPCTKQKVWVNIRQLDSTKGGCVTVKATDCAGNITIEDVCFPKYPLHPDTIPPRIRLVMADTSFNGSFCNMKYDSLLVHDDTTFDVGLASITLTPQITPVNMLLSVQPFPLGSIRQGFAVHVLDSLIDGSISIRATDRAGNFTDYPLNYCTIADSNPPGMNVVQTGPYAWSVFADDSRPYDRGLDTIDIHNRVNIDIYKNGSIIEPDRTFTRDKHSFSLKVQVRDTSLYAHFCVKVKDLADSVSPNLDRAHWWSADTCLERKPGVDIFPPNILLDPSPFANPTVVQVNVNDIHYFTPSIVIGWDKGVDKVWFDSIDGYTIPADTLYGNCLDTLPAFTIRVTDPTAIKKISKICIHARDCAGNQTDTCLYYPVAPDDKAPYIYGTQPSRAEVDLIATDSNQFDRGLRHLVLTNAVNFDAYEKFVNGTKVEFAPITVTDLKKSAIGTFTATDLWGSSSGTPQDIAAHSTSANVAIYVQDLAMKIKGVAQQNADVAVPVVFVANDTFPLVQKNIIMYSYSFDLVGDPNFSYVGIDTTGTASTGWNVAGVQLGTRVTVTGRSVTGLPLSRQELPLIKIILHSSADESTREVTLTPVVSNGASVIYNDDKPTTLTGTHTRIVLAAAWGHYAGVTLVAQGYCSPGLSTNTLVNSATLENVSPNPFRGTTEISYAVPLAGYTTLIVYDALGNEITRLVNADVGRGYHTVTFNGAGLSAGTYYVRLQTGSATLTKRMSLAH